MISSVVKTLMMIMMMNVGECRRQTIIDYDDVVVVVIVDNIFIFIFQSARED